MSFQFRQNMPNSIMFGDSIGTLCFDDDKLIFTGNADESAKILFDFVVAQFNSHIQKAIADEREACAKWLEELREHQTNQSLLDVTDCAEAIRMRGKE
jgi:hypothetical protein